MAEPNRNTEQDIENALLELMGGTPYGDISISAIARKAGISRQGFYLHFKDKDAVLVGYFQRLFAEIMASAQENPVDTSYDLVRIYTREVRRRADTLKLLADNALDIHLRIAFVQELTAHPPVFPCQKVLTDEAEWRFCYTYWVSAFIAVYTQWLAEGMRTPEAELNRILTNIMSGEYFRMEGSCS